MATRIETTAKEVLELRERIEKKKDAIAAHLNERPEKPVDMMTPTYLEKYEAWEDKRMMLEDELEDLEWDDAHTTHELLHLLDDHRNLQFNVRFRDEDYAMMVIVPQYPTPNPKRIWVEETELSVHKL